VRVLGRKHDPPVNRDDIRLLIDIGIFPSILRRVASRLRLRPSPFQTGREGATAPFAI